MSRSVNAVLSRIAARIACFAIAPVIVLGLAAPLHAGPIDDGLFALTNRSYAEAYRLLRGFADEGNPAAQYAIGVIYEEGAGVPQSFAEALTWYKRSSDQGSPYGHFYLGDMYFRGKGVEKDYVTAAALFQLAAEKLDDDCHKEKAELHLWSVSFLMTDTEREEAARRAAAFRPAVPAAGPGALLSG
jgi:TPR repeat protein